MTIASEISRLQTAKINMRNSIQNKGVSVPSTAKLDTYSSYIDQIQSGGGGALTGGLKLYPYQIYGSTYRGVDIGGLYSFSEGNIYYGLNAIYTYGNSHDEHCYGICTYKKTANSDITYSNSFSDLYGAYHSAFNNVVFYKKGTEVRCYIVTDNDAYPREKGYNVWRRYTWDYSANTIVADGGGTSNYDNPVDWGEDLDGRTLVSGSTWVQSATGLYDAPDGSIYLTLK